MTLRVLDLFSGIGGFSLGLERTGGFQTVAFCEVAPFCRRVLAKHWPGVPCYDDVRTLTADRLRADGIGVDAMCGGFPCQDISVAGAGAGIDGERSGLWREYARLIGETRPRWVIVENVSALLSRGLGRVLGDLAALGYDAEWHCIPAAALGAPHHRDRLWLVAYPLGERREGDCTADEWSPISQLPGAALADTNRQPGQQGRHADRGCVGPHVADADSLGVRGAGRGADASAPGGVQGQAQERQRVRPDTRASGGRWHVADPNGPRLEIQLAGQAGEREAVVGACAWSAEPDVGRMAYGVPARVDRLRSLGNAVVPAIPEIIGRAILAAEGA